MDSATPIAARRILLQGSPHLTMRAHNANAAARHPETGVHKPTNRSALTIIAATSRIAGSPGWATVNPRRPEATTVLHATSRRIRRPAPGQPCANVEKRRRRSVPLQACHSAASRTSPLGSVRPLFWVPSKPALQDWIMPRLTPIIAACVLSVAPSLERIFLTRPLTLSSVIESS
jgi:hypothetical protein